MKRVIVSLLIIAGVVLAASCQRHTCPTYLKAPAEKQEAKRS